MAARASMGPVQDGAVPVDHEQTGQEQTGPAPIGSQDAQVISEEGAAVAPAGADPELDATDPALMFPIAGLAVLVGLVLAPLFERVARWTFPRASLSTGPSFSWRDIVAVGLVLFALQIVVGMVAHGLALDLDSLLVALPLTVVWQGGTAFFVLALATHRRFGIAALGLRPGEHRWAAGYGLARYCGWGPFLFALMALTPLLLERVFGVSHEPQLVAEMIAGAGGLERLLVPLFAVLLIPLLEELLFRGFLQNALEPHIGAWPAVVLTSLAFATMHGVSAAIPIFGLSLILGVIMLRTRRLSACWFVHGLHNGMTTALLFLAPETLLEHAP
jgi:membrane protease YdiL (CAAX protease family)